MSTARHIPASPPPQTEIDYLFRYGTRFVTQIDEHGRRDLVPVPLTLEDWLHPQLGDHLTQNEPHAIDCAYLFTTFRMLVRDRADAVVFGDQNINWGIPGLRHHCPDAAVVLNVPHSRADYATFEVAREGARPELVIEVTSPATRNEDLHTKRLAYWQAGVEYYAIVDQLPRRRQRTLRILGYRRGRRGYQRLPLNAQGRLWLPTLGIWLGHEEGQIVCYDAQGQPILDRTEAEVARLQAEDRARQAEDRARLAEAEIERLRAQLEQLPPE